MNNIKIRKSQQSDKEALVDLWWSMQVSHREYDSLYYADKGSNHCRESYASYLETLIIDKNYILFSALCGKDIVGMLVAQIVENPPIYQRNRSIEVEVTVVNEAYRKQGIFRALIEKLIATARELEIDVLELMVDTDNLAGIVYKKLGFNTRQHRMVKWLPNNALPD
jgi:ribosomal protein S18 acetylase RimI-like enzyme